MTTEKQYLQTAYPQAPGFDCYSMLECNRTFNGIEEVGTSPIYGQKRADLGINPFCASPDSTLLVRVASAGTNSLQVARSGEFVTCIRMLVWLHDTR